MILQESFNFLVNRCPRVSQPVHGLQQFPAMSRRALRVPTLTPSRRPLDELANAKNAHEISRNVITTSPPPFSFSPQSWLLTTHIAVPPAEVSLRTQMQPPVVQASTRASSPVPANDYAPLGRDSLPLFTSTPSTEIGALPVTSFTCSGDAHSNTFRRRM